MTGIKIKLVTKKKNTKYLVDAGEDMGELNVTEKVAGTEEVMVFFFERQYGWKRNDYRFFHAWCAFG